MTLLLIPKGVILSERPCNHAEVVKSREAAVFRRHGLPREKYGMFDWRTRTRTVKRRLVKHHIIFGCALTNETDRDCCLAENKWLTDELLHRQGRGERLKTWTSHHFAHIECTVGWSEEGTSCHVCDGSSQSPYTTECGTRRDYCTFTRETRCGPHILWTVPYK